MYWYFNENGNIRSLEENKLLVLALKTTLDYHIEFAKANVIDWNEISWLK